MSFIKELRRRNVIRVAIAYAVASWLLIEVSATTFPLLNLPEWTATFVTVMLMIGFPVALILAWAYELTPEGLKKEREVDRSQSITHVTGRNLDFIIIGIMAVAIAYFLLDKFVWVAEEPPTAAAVTEERRSIAVLPFANRSDNPQDVFFVDGIHDDVLTQISRIGALKVISRTSVMEYRDTTKNLKAIGDELGVATILEGGVQRAGDQIRINVQLIDTGTDEHLWADTYDELRARLSPTEQEQLANVPTENLAALESYFLGKHGMEEGNSRALAEAVDHFQQAIERDPNFTLAYVGLADSYILQIQYLGRPRSEMLPKAEAAIDKALELDDQLGEVHTTLGRIQAWNADYAAAEAAFKRALELNPNHASAYRWYAQFLRRDGRLEEALPYARRALELDPRSVAITLLFGSILRDLGLHDEALVQYEKTIALNPTYAPAHRNMARLHRVWGKFDEAAVWYRKAIALDSDHPSALANLGSLYLELGDEQQAERWLSRSIELAPERVGTIANMARFSWHRGHEAEALDYARKVPVIDPGSNYASWMFFLQTKRELQTGHYAEARARIEKSNPELLVEDEPIIDEENLEAAISLAYVLTQTGELERAELLLTRALAFFQTIPKWSGWRYRTSDVRIYALQGQTAEALAALRVAIDAGWRQYWRYELEDDPMLDSIRDEPEFQAMVAEIRADMAAQLARLREWEANGELAPIPESLE
jgi:TolB-like protein/Tfp pilus assembly protein PilF